MAYLTAALCIGLMTLCLPLLIFGLPGNWIMLVIAGLWSYFSGAAFGWSFFIPLLGLALAGEALEFLLGIFAGKRFGGTGKGNIGGIIGGILGGIFGAGFGFGLGALPGALLGAFGGSFVLEKLHGMERNKALHAALGTMLGRFGGFMVKLGIGITIFYLCLTRIWQSIGVA
jgi:uncharacterized protein YqgC (DUF456 family)